MRYIVHVRDVDTNELYVLGANVPFIVKGSATVCKLVDVEESFIPMEVTLVDKSTIMVQCEDDQFYEFVVDGIYDGTPVSYVEL